MTVALCVAVAVVALATWAVAGLGQAAHRADHTELGLPVDAYCPPRCHHLDLPRNRNS